jgi:hypothetical protein
MVIVIKFCNYMFDWYFMLFVFTNLTLSGFSIFRIIIFSRFWF